MKSKEIILSIILLFLGLIYYYSFNYVYSSTINNLLNQQIENSKNQAQIVSNLVSEKLKEGYSKKEVINELQKSIENTSTENSFICMFDDTGKEICHPNAQRIGKTLSENNSILKSISNQDLEKNFKEAIMEKKSVGGIREMKNASEIVYLSPVKNTEWIVASHSNIVKFKELLKNLKEKLSLLFILVWLSSSTIIYFFLQYINSNSLNKISELNKEISTQYFNELKTLNESISKSSIKNKIENERLLANKGAQLVPVYIENIAFIYTENKISYIVELNKERSSINLALDELFKNIDKNIFYRASRQVIVSAKAIDKIEKYGVTQLKIITNPISPIDIIISKNKLTDFKKWMGKN